MSIREYSETWPYLEQFTPALAMNHQERLGSWPLLQSMDVRLEKVEKDYTKLSIVPPSDLFRPKGAWQGGLLATLVDTTAGQALRTTLKADHDAVTVHLDAKYFLPVDDERVFAEGSVVRKGRNLAHIDVAIVKQGGALVARGWCVLKLIRRAETAATENHLPPPPALPTAPPDCDSFGGGQGI
jgi:uncharacterized protein (TIGR00369 family)